MQSSVPSPDPSQAAWLTQPQVAPELQQHTRTRVLMATWGTRMALRTRHGEGSTEPQDTALDSTHTASSCHAGCLSWHCRATCWDISLATRCCHVWKGFTEPPSLAGGETRAEGPTFGWRCHTRHRQHHTGAIPNVDEPLQGSQGRSQLTPTLHSHGTVDPLHGTARHSSSPTAQSPRCPGQGWHSGHSAPGDTPRSHAIPGCWRQGENAKSPHFFEVAPRRRGQGGKQFAAKSLHLICATFRQPHQLWMAGKQARCALRPARPEPTLTPNGPPVTMATRANSRKDF